MNRLEENRRRNALGYGVPIGGLVDIVDIGENNYFVGSPPKNPKPNTIYIGDNRPIILIKNNVEIDLFETINNLTKRLEIFELEVKYMPDGEGYQEVKNDFELIKEEW
jgi:hypothetical protein